MAALLPLALAAAALTAPARWGASLHRPAARVAVARRLPPPLLAQDPLIDQLKQELPSNALLRAIDRCGGSVTAADAAAESGQGIGETRRQLLVLARLVGGEMQVSEGGELVFVFPSSMRRELRSASAKQRVKDGWDVVSPSLYWLLRASFGVALLTSITIVITGITALSQGKEDNNGRSSSSLPSMSRMWGPHPLDFLYYSSRPYRYTTDDPQEIGFLQSCFSFLFGDANPNANFDLRTSQAVAALIRQSGGAVTAEQLAPLLLPELTPEQFEEERNRPGAPSREEWVLPALIQFGGEPKVTDDGDIVYVFPELMRTAAEPAIAAGAGALAVASPNGLPLGWSERPAGWRPREGDRVTVATLLRGRRRPDAERMAERMIGKSGTIVGDGRDGLPFEVVMDVTNRADYFVLDELVPAAPQTNALQELPETFSTAPPQQLTMAGLLGVANLVGVLYLGAVLSSSVRYCGTAVGVAAALRRIYPALLAYGAGFIALPAARSVRVNRRNRQIEARNAVRAAWGRVMDSRPAGSLRRKLAAAKSMRSEVRKLSDSDATFSSARSVEEQQLSSNSLDDFDERLKKASEKLEDGK